MSAKRVQDNVSVLSEWFVNETIIIVDSGTFLEPVHCLHRQLITHCNGTFAGRSLNQNRIYFGLVGFHITC